MADSQHFPHFSHPTGDSTRLVMVRHGQTTANADRLLHGRTDLPLNDLGLLQAERVAARILEEFDVDAIVSSPLERASTTASIIGHALGMEHIHDEGLLEMDFGDFEGMSVEELFAMRPDIAAMAFDPDNSDLRWPNGESRREFHRRVLDAFSRIARNYALQHLVVVSHNGVLGSFLAQVRGASPDNWQAYGLANCSISAVEIVADGTIVHAVNDCTHLDKLVSTYFGPAEGSS